MKQIDEISDEFGAWAKRHGLSQAPVKIEPLGVPHRPIALPVGWQGIYCFRFGPAWLKVGKAGPNSGARWVSHHYKCTRALSTLAWSLIRYAHGTSEDPRTSNLKALLQRVSPYDIEEWIKRHTERVNILIREEMGSAGLTRLEDISHRILDPVFEGRWKFGGPAGA